MWEVLSQDAFWKDVRGVRWTETGTGARTGAGTVIGDADRAGLTVRNPSKHAIQLAAVVLRGAPQDGPRAHWRPADRLVLAAKRGEPTVLTRPVLLPAEQVQVRPGHDLTLDLPGTVRPGSVDAIVLTGLFEGRAVKQWRLGEQGVVDVLRDDRVPLTAGDGFRALLELFGSQR
ncbi:hypothetical protein [Ornithinimicrobium sufpigmenti]|uniref:hypothetical protein n=1 Tax=Ornithinimicrobium sufpigmenti TaxID=2508882 RepID=UPI0015E1624D|nr:MULTISPECIES: hypothetical protein [unclassified Ornithinimicrobium]